MIQEGDIKIEKTDKKGMPHSLQIRGINVTVLLVSANVKQATNKPCQTEKHDTLQRGIHNRCMSVSYTFCTKIITLHILYQNHYSTYTVHKSLLYTYYNHMLNLN